MLTKSISRFAQIVFCGDCGEFFRRVHWNNRGCKSIVWRCCSRLEATGHACHARTVNEELLKEVAIEAINQVLCKKDDFLNTLQTNIATVIKQGDTLSPEVIDERLRELQKELVKKANQKDDYPIFHIFPDSLNWCILRLSRAFRLVPHLVLLPSTEQ